MRRARRGREIPGTFSQAAIDVAFNMPRCLLFILLTGRASAVLVGPAAGAMPPSFRLPNDRSVILFDGVCSFCNAWVAFVIDNDPAENFCFASMQSSAGRRLLDACGRPADDLSTFVLIDNAGFFTQSTAALRVAQRLNLVPLSVAGSALQVVPPAVRDGIYRAVADNRYSILGRAPDGGAPSCQLRYDLSTLKERFLDYGE